MNMAFTVCVAFASGAAFGLILILLVILDKYDNTLSLLSLLPALIFVNCVWRAVQSDSDLENLEKRFQQRT